MPCSHWSASSLWEHEGSLGCWLDRSPSGGTASYSRPPQSGLGAPLLLMLACRVTGSPRFLAQSCPVRGLEKTLGSRSIWVSGSFREGQGMVGLFVLVLVKLEEPPSLLGLECQGHSLLPRRPPLTLWYLGSVRAQIFLGEPIMTFDTKLTMALAGCSGSCSANRWHMLSVALPCFRATNPKILQKGSRGQITRVPRLKRGVNPSHLLHHLSLPLTPSQPGPRPLRTPVTSLPHHNTHQVSNWRVRAGECQLQPWVWDLSQSRFSKCGQNPPDMGQDRLLSPVQAHGLDSPRGPG